MKWTTDPQSVGFSFLAVNFDKKLSKSVKIWQITCFFKFLNNTEIIFYVFIYGTVGRNRVVLDEQKKWKWRNKKTNFKTKGHHDLQKNEVKNTN